MTRDEVAIDLVGALVRLTEQMDRIEQRQVALTDAVLLETVTVDDLARFLGLKPSTLRSQPWNLPNFGESEFAGQSKRWRKGKAMAWYDRPGLVRRAEWEERLRKQTRDRRTA